MSCLNNNFSTLNFVTSLNDTFYINSIEENLKTFFDYGLLNVGGFINVNTPTSGLYNNVFHKLKPVEDPANKANTLWITPKQNWVWETGVCYNNEYPNNISGIFVNNAFYPAPTGASGISYSLDYPNGQITFNKAIASTVNVSMNYSYKWCKVLKASDDEGRRILQQFSYKSLNTKDEPNHGLQLPCIIFETIPRGKSTAYELGSLTTIRDQDVLAHIYTESDTQRKMLVDIFKLQEEKMIKIFDSKIVSSSGLYGLKSNGNINPSGLNYGQIVSNDNLIWNKAMLKDVSFIDSKQNISSTLFWCIVRLTVQIIY